MIGLLSIPALAQVPQGVSDGLTPNWSIEDCSPYVIAGTVPYGVARQSVRTNAQAFGAVAFAEDLLLPSDRTNLGFRFHSMYNVARLPTVGVCPTDVQYGTAGLDLYGASGGLLAELPLFDGDLELRVFYAGSVTGSAVQFPSNRYLENRYVTSELYAASSVLAAYAAPLAPLLTSDRGLQSIAGDFVVGTELGLPKHPDTASLRLGYVYSQGLYSNLSSRRLYLFGTALLADRFSVLALVKAGLDHLPISEQLGKTSLFGRNQALTAAAGPSDGAATLPRIDLSTVHLQQRELVDGLLDLSVALAVRPEVFLHEGSVGLNYVIHGDDGLDLRAISARGGVVELPAQPWYGVDGGMKPFFEVVLGDIVHVRRNVPESLVIFPYAQDATEITVQFHFEDEP